MEEEGEGDGGGGGATKEKMTQGGRKWRKTGRGDGGGASTEETTQKRFRWRCRRQKETWRNIGGGGGERKW